jgi:hypothetical protein
VTNGKSLPKDVIDLWPEIFDHVKLNVVPLNYVHSIEITFKNKKIWEIDCKRNLKTQSWEEFEIEIKSVIGSYEDDIQSIDFKLDTDRIKKDISRSTKRFLRNRKLK